MAHKKVIWSARAKNELKNILKFYNERNKSNFYSLKLLDEIEDLTQTLSENEFIGRLTSNKLTRVIPMNVYLVFYEVKIKSIEIVSFWDNRQEENNKIK